MTAKRFLLATSMMVLVAMSGQAYAGTTISDTRYWPSEASSAVRKAAHRPENAFDAVETARGIHAPQRSYHGGPKSDY